MRTTYQNRPMTFHESLHLCGCDSCRNEILWRVQNEPPLKQEFVDYLRAQYPNTAALLAARSDEREIAA